MGSCVQVGEATDDLRVIGSVAVVVRGVPTHLPGTTQLLEFGVARDERLVVNAEYRSDVEAVDVGGKLRYVGGTTVRGELPEPSVLAKLKLIYLVILLLSHKKLEDFIV